MRIAEDDPRAETNNITKKSLFWNIFSKTITVPPLRRHHAIDVSPRECRPRAVVDLRIAPCPSITSSTVEHANLAAVDSIAIRSRRNTGITASVISGGSSDHDPGVMAPRPVKLAISMCQGRSCTGAVGESAPWMRRTFVSMPSMFAPSALRKRQKS